MLTNGRLVAPGWILGVAGAGTLRQRLPCRFLVPVGDDAVAEAYEGLVEHLEALQDVPRAGELMLTSIVWRIGAILDGLEDNPDSDAHNLNARFHVVRGRVTRSRSFESFEKATWDELSRFADRRNTLSHLLGKNGFTFAQCVAEAQADAGAGVRSAAAAISLAIAQQIATEFDGERPAEAARAVESEIGSIEI